MPSFLSRLQRSFLHRRKDDTTRTTHKAQTPAGHAVQSDTNLLAPKKDSLQPSSASANGDVKADPRPKMSPTASRKFSFSRTDSSKAVKAQKAPDVAPHLSLQLPDPDPIDRPAAPLFDGIGRTLVDMKEIGAKRLTPAESLALLQSGSVVVVERGLETLGIFRPHWHSESPLIQQSLISLFITSLPTPNTPGTVGPSDTIQTELRYTSDPHDVTSVIKWGLRHLHYEHDQFVSPSKNNPDQKWSWYRDFTYFEREAGYPADAFSSILLQRLPALHGELLKCTLDLISSVAAHADANAMSGSKLSKALALWIISPRSALPKTWDSFYEEWDTTSRIMEHIFLAFVRDMERHHKLPTRLAELVTHYPYSRGAPTDDYILPRPRFTTHRFKALVVRLRKERVRSQEDGPRPQPLELLGEALTASYASSVDAPPEIRELWDMMRTSVILEKPADVVGETPIQVSHIASDECLRIMSMCDVDEPLSPLASSPTTAKRPPSIGRTKRRSFSLDNGRSKPPHSSLSVLYEDGMQPSRVRSDHDLNATYSANARKVDWDSFSSSGFGFIDDSIGSGLASSLTPSDSTAGPNGLSGNTKAERRKSMKAVAEPQPSFVNALAVVPLDEAFIDVWTDTLLDPMVRTGWPEFLLCQLSETMRSACASQGFEWLIVERELVDPPPAIPQVQKPQAVQRTPSNVSAATTTRFARSFSRASSDLRGKKRFSLFGTSTDHVLTAPIRGRKASSTTVVSKQPSISEMGEVGAIPNQGVGRHPLDNPVNTSPAALPIGPVVQAGGKEARSAAVPVAAPSPVDGQN